LRSTTHLLMAPSGIQMLDSGTSDITHIEPWRRPFAIEAGQAAG